MITGTDRDMVNKILSKTADPEFSQDGKEWTEEDEAKHPREPSGRFADKPDHLEGVKPGDSVRGIYRGTPTKFLRFNGDRAVVEESWERTEYVFDEATQREELKDYVETQVVEYDARRILPKNHYSMTADSVDALRAKVADLEKIREKKGLPGKPYTVEIINPEFYQDEEIGNRWYPPWASGGEEAKKTGAKRDVSLIKFTGDPPKFAGWSFMAKMTPMVDEETGLSSNIVASSAGTDPVPREYRTAVGICEHCNTNRKRTETFVLQNEEDGEYKAVGRNCLKDFLGHTDINQYASFLDSIGSIQDWIEENSLDQVDNDSSDDDGSRDGPRGSDGERYFSAERFLGVAASMTRQEGYKKTSEEDSTKELVGFVLSPPPANKKLADLHADMIKKYMPTDLDKQLANDAIEWAKTLGEDKNEYMYNLYVTASLGKVSKANAGVAASLVSTYAKVHKINLSTGAKKEKANQEHVGEVDEYSILDLTVNRSRETERPIYNSYGDVTGYGPGSMIHFRDENNSELVWFSDFEKIEEYPPGSKHKLRFKVKRHDVYDKTGELQTVINRVSPYVEPTKVKAADINWDEERKAFTYGDYTVVVDSGDKTGADFSVYKSGDLLNTATQSVPFDVKKAKSKIRGWLQKLGADGSGDKWLPPTPKEKYLMALNKDGLEEIHWRSHTVGVKDSKEWEEFSSQIKNIPEAIGIHHTLIVSENNQDHLIVEKIRRDSWGGPPSEKGRYHYEFRIDKKTGEVSYLMPESGIAWNDLEVSDAIDRAVPGSSFSANEGGDGGLPSKTREIIRADRVDPNYVPWYMTTMAIEEDGVIIAHQNARHGVYRDFYRVKKDGSVEKVDDPSITSRTYTNEKNEFIPGGRE